MADCAWKQYDSGSYMYDTDCGRHLKEEMYSDEDSEREPGNSND